ncbi:MAG: 2,3,4,5-tetrahydropyridine-2,6-dicarboxylate N-acetyltransferase [Bacteroidia bacterium]|nr:2,3,4,5-tetrahydropyridine-2,6-dicarboxylate N-acetyltransferase [Bacteroidia bacterium]
MKMMSFIKKIIYSLFWKAIPIEEIIKKQNEYKIARFLEQVSIGHDSKFYEEASGFNLTGNKSKILIGDNTHIRGEIFVYPYSDGIHIGNNSYIGKNTVIRSGEKILIGSNVLIAHNVTIIDSDSHEINYKERSKSYIDMLKYGHPKEKGNVETAPIIIGDHAWISYNVSILKGVVIGTGAIIGAGSVVTKDVAPWTLVAGNPAVEVKKLKS